MRKLVYLLFLVAVSSAHAGLIVQEVPGTVAPGATAMFDLILKNETASANWLGINAVGPLKFATPEPTLPAQPIPSYPAGAIQADPFWDFSFAVLGEFNFGTSFPKSVNLLPGQQLNLGTLAIDIPAGFVGSFDIKLAPTSVPFLALGSGIDVTDSWAGDPNPPIVAPPGPPGPGGASGFSQNVFVTAVPEPSAFLFLGLIGIACGGRQIWRRRSNS